MRSRRTDYRRTQLGLERLEDRTTPSAAVLQRKQPSDAIGTGDLRVVVGEPANSSAGSVVTAVAAAGVTTIAKASRTSTTTAFTASPSSPVVHKPLNVTITVRPVSGTVKPTGTVTIKDSDRVIGTATLQAGRATYSTSGLAAGVHRLSVVYGGTSTCAGSTSSTLRVTVAAATTASKTATHTTISATTASPAVNKPVHLTITVHAATGSGTPSGTVTVKDGDRTLGTVNLQAGHATFSTSGLVAGTHRLSAIYTGMTTFVSSRSAVATVTVASATPTARRTTTTLTASPMAVAAGQRVTLTASVAAAGGSAAPTGRVTFKDGSTVLGTAMLSGGRATFTTSTLTAGTHHLTVTYGGAAGLAASSSATVLLTAGTPAAKAGTQTTLAASTGSTTYGQPVTFTATVRRVSGTATPTGTVTFKDGTVIVGTVAVTSAGSASLTLSRLRGGSHALTATYNGDTRFKGGTAAARALSVKQAQAAVTFTPPTTVSAGSPITLRATVKVTNGSVIVPGGQLIFKAEAKVLGTVTLDRTGTATLTVPAGTLTVGEKWFAAGYNGTDSFTPDGAGDIVTVTR
jgi:hypothetical protein